MERKYNILLLIVVIIWGAGFVAVEYLIDANWSSTLIMTFRFLIASVILFAIFFKKIITVTLKEIYQGAGLGFLIFLAFLTQTIGQNYTNLSNVAFFTATNVIMIPFISWGIIKKKPSIKMIVLCFMCLLGVSFLTFKSGTFEFRIGDILSLACAFFFASQIAILDKIVKEVDPEKINFLQIFFAFVFSAVALMFSKTNYSEVNFSAGIVPLIYIGLFSTLICYLLQTYAQKHVSATDAGIIFSLEAFFGSIFSVLFGIESVTLNMLLGGGIIIMSAILANIGEEV